MKQLKLVPILMCMLLSGCSGCNTPATDNGETSSPTVSSSAEETVYPDEPQDDIAFDEVIYDENGATIRAVRYQKDASFAGHGDMITLKTSNTNSTGYILYGSVQTINGFRIGRCESAFYPEGTHTSYIHCWTDTLKYAGVSGNVKTVTITFNFGDFQTGEPLEDMERITVTIHVPSDEPYDEEAADGQLIYEDDYCKVTGYYARNDKRLMYIMHNNGDEELVFSSGKIAANGKELVLETGLITLGPGEKSITTFDLTDALVKAGRITPEEITVCVSYNNYDDVGKMIENLSIPFTE